MTLTAFRVLFRKMSSKNLSSLTPVGVRGMKVLDRAKFLRNIEVPTLKLLNVSKKNLFSVIQHCKPILLKLENFLPVQDYDDGKLNKCLHLNPDVISSWSDLNDDIREVLVNNSCTKESFTIQEVEFGYDNWSYDTIFKAVLPENEEIVSGYSIIDHIIHVNLRDHLMPYRQLIGQVLLDKIKRCRTVVNKTKIIDNTYRNFKMEVIAGEEDYMVTVIENRCKFQFDFSKVYWNPRLSKEHERILNNIRPGDILFDVFCGVGPFAVPAAKNHCKVYANDLNPDSYRWLNENAKNNKVNDLFFTSYNMDGKDFIIDVIKPFLLNVFEGKQLVFGDKIYITMNLPAMAVKFMKYFKGLLKQMDTKIDCDIIVYLYCFVVSDNLVEAAKELVNDNMGCDLSPHILDVFNVRNVAPKKEMMRVTLKLTKDILFYVNQSNLNEPPSKKLCAENKH